MRPGANRKDVLPTPDYFSAKGLLRDDAWVESYMALVLQWPKSCKISLKDRQLIGLAKSLAFGWEPGILNHTDLALKTGSTKEQVSSVLQASSATASLARLQDAISALPKTILSPRRRAGSAKNKELARVKEFFGFLPSIFTAPVLAREGTWYADFLAVTRPAYDSSDVVVRPGTRALVCLSVSAVLGWHDGIASYSRAALRFGVLPSSVSDVVKSVFKTSYSNAMAEGFRTPCHIPKLNRYSTILRAYYENGALDGEGDALN